MYPGQSFRSGRAAMCLGMVGVPLWVLLIAGLVGCASVQAPAKTSAEIPTELSVDDVPPEMVPLRFDDLLPAAPQPEADNLRPGLAVVYFYKFFKRNVRDLPSGGLAQMLGKPGKPIPRIHHQFADGPVFDSGEQRGVGMRMTGFLELKNTGVYHFRALSNDGVQIYLSERLVIEDPDVHSDRLSIPAIVTIRQPGWYRLNIDYFQRKGTAALALYWRRPGDATYRPIPAAAYAHLPQDTDVR